MKPIFSAAAFAALLLLPLTAAVAPRGAVTLEAGVQLPPNWRFHLELASPSTASVAIGKFEIFLGQGREHDIALERPEGSPPVLRVWSDGVLVRGPEPVAELAPAVARDFPGEKINFGADFTPDFTGGTIKGVKIWKRALPDAEISLLFKEGGAGANTPDFYHAPEAGDATPIVKTPADTEVKTSWIQALERSDHAEIIGAWNQTSLAEGRQIYSNLCVVCHGTKDAPGSLPTATNFATGESKNGADPYSMYHTLTHGYGQMVAQPQYTTAQKYAVIQYIREEFVRPHNPGQFTPITADYLKGLPKALAVADAEVADRSLPPHQRMDLGPSLFWTYQIAPDNIARKGLAVRLDDGPGGVSKGRAWMIYDHDTLRLAAATTGSFIDWRDIAFDGSHGTSPKLTGEKHFTNPDAPGWASPEGSWDDPRPIGKDGKPFGPLPRGWARLIGLHHHGSRQIISAEIAGIPVLEEPAWIEYGTIPVFTRTLNIGPGSATLRLRVAPESVNVALAGEGSLTLEKGFHVAILKPESQLRLFISAGDSASLDALAKAPTAPLDLNPLLAGGPPRWPELITTRSETTPDSNGFGIDHFPLPTDNPWQSWMRPGGFDFTPDGAAAIVAMWNGDIWRVDGIREPAPADLRWRRIASGLFQPLGVKFRGDDLFVICRDQLARLRDLNGDGEIDFIDCFNNDHQVTEHFHEFAMGLQTDDAGNFYYAKSGRHALDSVVPHHGTLLKVAADGSRTEILATGFRAANGVCLNPDGTFFVTDQEGFWTPKNRINHVKKGGFYGNMFGFTEVADTSDSAMEPPMVWITNKKDRSPAELVWIPQNAWGPLGGSLLNLSYGTGNAFIIPHEEINGVWQGAVCELPIPSFKTGIMRGRFAGDGALYTCGMFAWAGNATSEGGFHRIRHLGTPAHVPVSIRSGKGRLSITFSDALDASSILPSNLTLNTWSIHRSAKYGSAHHDERALEVTAASLSPDGRTLTLTIPDLAPTPCYELALTLRGTDGTAVSRILHGTLHQLGGN